MWKIFTNKTFIIAQELNFKKNQKGNYEELGAE